MTTLDRRVVRRCTSYRVGENAVIACGVHVWVARMPQADLARIAFPDGACAACAH